MASDVHAPLVARFDPRRIIGIGLLYFREVIADASLRMAFRFLLRVVRPERIAENRLVCLGNRNVANRDVADAQIGIDVPQVGAIGQVRVVPRVVGTG